jgi:Fe-S oxidoreductase
MFDRNKCVLCGQCRDRCLYIDYAPGTGAEEWEKLVNGEPVSWLHQCITCFACNEYCPNDARPFDLILKRLEERGDYVNPQLLSLAQQMFTPKKPFTPPASCRQALSLCTIYTAIPWAFSGPLFEGLTPLKGTHYFCGLVYPHMGNDALMREGLQPLIDKYASLGAEEIVFAHDDCYTVMTDAVERFGMKLPFKPVHLFEHLRDRLVSRQADIRPLNMKAAYQRPCASRLTPWKEPLLDEIFELIGVIRVDRRYDRENAMCCGQDMGGIQKRGDKFPAYKQENISDARKSGAEAMVYLCPMCLDALGRMAHENGLANYMISDLCRMSLGETLPAEAYALFR